MNTQNNNTATPIDLSSINYESVGRREKGTELVDFFAEKVLTKKPTSIDVVPVKGMHKLVFSKIGNKVRAHHIKTNGLNIQVAEVKAEEMESLQSIMPEAYKPKVKVPKSTKKPDRTVFDAEGNVLRQAPIGVIDRQYVWQLECLANEYVEMDPNANFGIHLRPAMWHGKPVSIMMTVYTAGSEKVKTASPKEVKINLLGNPDKIEEWLAHVQSVYNECAERLLDEPIEHESGFKFDRRAFLNGELIVVSAEKTELTPQLIESLKALAKQK